MKYLILLLVSFPSFACLNSIDVTSAISVQQNGYGAEMSCKSNDCVCADGIDLTISELIDETVNGSPIYSHNNVTACVQTYPILTPSEEASEVVFDTTIPLCSDVLTSLVCNDKKEEKFINEGYTEVYCSKLVGHEQVPTGKKILVENEVKKKAHEKALKDAEKAEKDSKDLKKQKKQEVKLEAQREVDFDKVKTIKALADEVKELRILIKKLIESQE